MLKTVTAPALAVIRGFLRALGVFARGLWRGLAGRLSLVFSLFLAILLVAAVLAGTERGRILLTRGAVFAADWLLGDYQIHAGSIQSPSLGAWEFSELQVSYRERVLARGENLFLILDLRQLLSARVDVETLSADEIFYDNDTLNALLADPEGEAEAAVVDTPTVEESEFELPPMRLGSLSIRRLRISDRELGEIPQVSLTASGSYRWPEQPAQLQLELLEESGAGLKAVLAAEESAARRYTVALSVVERAGGFVGGLLHLPEGQHLDAQARIELWQPSAGQLLLNVERLSAPLVEHQFSLTGRAAIDFSPWKIASEGLELEVDGSLHRISGTVSAEQLDAEVHLNRLPVSLSHPWQDVLEGGWLSADLEVSGPLALPGVSGSVELHSHYRGQPLVLSSQLQTRDQVIELQSARLQLADAQLQAQGRVDIADESLDLGGEVRQLDLASIRELLIALALVDEDPIPAELDGHISHLQVTAAGPWNNPQLTARLDGSVSYSEFEGQLQAAAQGDLNEFALSEIALRGDNLRVSGSGILGIERETVQLQLDVAASDLRPARMGLPLEEDTNLDLDAAVAITGPWDNPQISARVQSEGNYHHEGRQYRYTLRGGAAGDSHKISLDRMRLDLYSASGEGYSSEARLRGPQSLIADERRGPVTALAADAARLGRAGSAWLELDGSIEPRAERLQGTVAGRNIPVSLLELAGVELPPTLDGEISVDGQVSGSFAKPEASAHLLALGNFRGEEWQLQGDFSYGDRRVELAEVELAWAGRNQLSAHGSLSEENLDLELRGRFTLMDFENWLPAELSDQGELTLWASASGSPQQPDLSGDVKLASRAPGQTAQELPLSAQLDWHTRAGELRLSLEAHHGRQQALDASGRLAVAPILEQLFAETAEPRPLPLDLEASGSADLAALAAFFDPEIHAMQGRLQFGLRGDGNLDNPNLRGSVELENGGYEHRPTSTRLRRIQLAVRLSPQQLRIERASAEDGERGSISLSGAATFADEGPAQLDFALSSRNVHLLNTPAARGAFSGDLHLAGSTEAARLEGRLSLRPLAIQIEHLIGSGVPEIEVLEVEMDGPPVERSSPLLERIALAVQVVLDQQSYVRGLGLDSELRGRVDIAGTAARPEAGGQLRIVRGNFDLLGKRFELQEGQVQFENNEAAIFVRGQHKYSDGTITAEITGTTRDLEVNFSSEPAAAQDEIFAQLLFGKSLTDISPLQAIRLVSVVRTLQSGGSVFDPVAKTRELIGVDTLDIQTEETDDGDQYALSLGKYITSRIYVELQRSTNPLNPWQAEMQVELNRNLNLELKSTDSSESGAGSVELLWKRDY